MKSNGSMNRFYRLVWNTAKQVMEPVAETAKSARKNGNSSGSVVAGVVASVALSLMAGMAFAQQAPPALTQLPTGGNVVRGAASISQVNTATQAILNINQSSAKAVINWNTFNLGQNAKVNFNQPSTSSVTLNQILDNNASQIYGQISANGQVFLSNPNGLYFSPTASVDVGGLVATTHSIDADAFMAGSTTFNRNGATGSVVNAGHLSAGLNGYIALLAPEAINSGVIVAQAGTVVLAAGEAITLNFSGNTSLASITTTPSTIATLVENRQAVLAPDGQIILSANALASLQAGIVKNSGSLQANSMSSHGGVIVLEGDDITLSSTSQIQAGGPTGGGTVLVGSGWQGQSIAQVNSTQQATTVTMEAGATIDASATQNGNGGQVVLWAVGTTNFSGNISANGAGLGGAGGNAEVSGKTLLNYTGFTNLLGSQGGRTGNLLLDPYNLYITTDSGGSITASSNNSILGVSTLTTALSAANVTVSTGSSGSQAGIIGVMTDITSSSTNNLTFTAASNVVLAGNVNIGGAFTVNSGGNFVMATSLSTAAGVTITANGGFSSTGSGTNYLTGNIATSGTPINITGPVQVANFNGGSNPLTLSSNGGNITLTGAVSNYSGSAQNYAVLMANNLYSGVTASTVTGSSTDIFLSYSAGTGLFLNQLGLPTSLSYLLVGGGGGGGGSYAGNFTGGGGGGGGVTAGTYTLTGNSLNITVGGGGTAGVGGTGNASSSSATSGGNGGDSSLGTIYVGGGGGGGRYGTNASSDPGSPGLAGYGTNNPAVGGRTYVAGGGGGGAGSDTNGGASGGTGSSQTGGSGGTFATAGGYTNVGGAGGGAGGSAFFSGGAPTGGAGISSSITGTAVTYGQGASVLGGNPSTAGGGGGAQGYGGATGAGAAGTAIIKYTVGSASTAAASALKLSAGAGSVTMGSSVSSLSSLEINAGLASSIAGAVSGTGSTLTNSGVGILTLNGVASYTGLTTVTSSGVVFNNNTAPTTSGFAGAGTVTIQPTTSFSSALNVNYTYATTLTGLTLGSSTNQANLTMASAVNIAGPISIRGGQVNINANLSDTQTSANAGINVLAGNNITFPASAITFSTSSASPVLLNANSLGTGGSIYGVTGNSLSITTLGGNITLGGGTALNGSGYATSPDATVLRVNDLHEDGIGLPTFSFSSGAGNVVMRGMSYGSATTLSAKYAGGIWSGSGSITTTSGSITIDGEVQSGASAYTVGYYGVYFGAPVSLVSGSGNITVTGINAATTTTNNGMNAYLSGSITTAS